jgi:Lar family restriction alleviation protein
MIELKPCPFCGCKGRTRYRKGINDYVPECSNDCCIASYMIGASFETEEEAATAWNRRAQDGGQEE